MMSQNNQNIQNQSKSMGSLPTGGFPRRAGWRADLTALGAAYLVGKRRKEE